MKTQIDNIYKRCKTEHTHKKQGDLVIDCSCVVHEGFVTFVGSSKSKEGALYHTTIWAGKYSGAKCDCKGYQIKKKCKHLLALAMWARGER